MPHVFTLEGLSAAQLAATDSAVTPNTGVTVVNYPDWGQPLAPTAQPIGPARPQVPVFGPGGTPVPYRRAYPARGPVCDYCSPEAAALNGDGAGLGADVTDFLRKQNPLVAGALVLGGSLLTGVVLGSLSVWILHKAGYRPPAAPPSRLRMPSYSSGYDDDYY
jgi:hypothetical protein